VRSTEHQRRGLRTIETALGLVLLAVVILVSSTVLRVWATAVFNALRAVVPLLRVDGVGTAETLALALARLGLAALPAALLLRSLPPRRRLWVATPLGMLTVISTPLSLTACSTPGRWLLLGLLSAAASVLVQRRFLGWTALLPFAVLWEVVPSHGLLNFADIGTRDPAYRAEILAECAAHDGMRPRNLTADHLMPYHGITPYGDDLVFLAGEGPNDGGMRGKEGGRRVGSWWLRRTNDGAYEIELPSEATGNLWRGCVVDGVLWMVRAGLAVGVERFPAGRTPYERVRTLPIPSQDMDLIDTACDANGRRLYVTEYLAGGLWEVPIDGSPPRRFAIGGGMLIPRWRFDGRLVLGHSGALVVFDPDARRVVERVPSGIASLGLDLCSRDGAAAVADTAGRLRVFELDGDGRYRFAWGVSVFAPRRVAYSPDCSRLAVTSADDHRVYLIDTQTRRIADVFRAGPALREVAPTGPREFSVSDVCSMTTYRW